MAKTPLSQSDDYELVDKARDIRGWGVQDHAGNVLGLVEELIVDTERETVTHIILDNKAQYSIRDIELAQDRILLRAAAAARETVQLETVTPTVDVNGDMHLQVLEERLRVGKRQVEQGGVRVTTVVTNQPVQTQVQLREEHVDVVRRPVDRTATAAEQATMFDRTVDVVERAEVPRVVKKARVVEEVVVKRAVDEHRETVHDMVRHTDVEVRDIKPPASELTP